MTTKDNLIRAIKRSEYAYQLYTEQKQYFQALRIYKANMIIYELLNEYIFECNEAYLNLAFEYLFHLEDWFCQFDMEKSKVKNLDQHFAFTRLKESIAFPKNFKNTLL
ncbi:hypothetical protein BA768_11135 [Chryseobacterium sp. CBo1]|nr:hypothetical protein BA768_11135 [Chryseobacterium sp. CBo1]